jgi:hypothetical protein
MNVEMRRAHSHAIAQYAAAFRVQLWRL